MLGRGLENNRAVDLGVNRGGRKVSCAEEREGENTCTVKLEGVLGVVGILLEKGEVFHRETASRAKNCASRELKRGPGR